MAGFAPIVCIVDFHHARGPEIETWLGVEDGSDPAIENDWSLLPFMALSDGAHASSEDYSYFTLRRAATETHPATSLFGISCTRQLDANELIDRPPEVTRSTVQKAVVVISDSPQHFGAVKAQLGVVTAAWFAQKDFTDLDIMQRFQESLATLLKNQEGGMDHYFGISLRELIHEFKWQTLVLFKCALLQPKMLFFGSHCERLCMMQFAIISLIPGLIRHLRDSADPKFNAFEASLVLPTSLKTSERSSLLTYMGLPLQLFGKGSLFGPYTPLQQLDMLADQDTKSYIVGSTNSLLLQQKDRYSDILINLDEHTVSITSASLRQALVLSTPDRRWIDFLTQTVLDTWDESDPGRPKDHGYAGSEEFIRMQFEEYLLAMLSAVKYKSYQEKNKEKEIIISDFEGDPASEFSNDYIHAWMATENYRIWNKFTDSHLFDIADPKHPCSGGLSIEDVQRRLAQQVAEMHLDERLHQSREVIGKQLAVGQKKVSSAFNNLWAEMEAMREANRKRQEEQRLAKEKELEANQPGTPASDRLSIASTGGKWKTQAPDLSQAQANLQAASTRAGAYLSSWGAWATEKKKGWGASRSTSGTPVASPLPSPAPTSEFKHPAAHLMSDKGLLRSSAPPGTIEKVVLDEDGNLVAAKRESLFFDAEEEEKESMLGKRKSEGGGDAKGEWEEVGLGADVDKKVEAIREQSVAEKKKEGEEKGESKEEIKEETDVIKPKVEQQDTKPEPFIVPDQKEAEEEDSKVDPIAVVLDQQGEKKEDTQHEQQQIPEIKEEKEELSTSSPLPLPSSPAPLSAQPTTDEEKKQNGEEKETQKEEQKEGKEPERDSSSDVVGTSSSAKQQQQQQQVEPSVTEAETVKVDKVEKDTK